MNKNDDLQMLFKKYLEGEMTQQEFQEFRELLEQHSDDQLSEELTALWNSSAQSAHSLSADTWNEKMKMLMTDFAEAKVVKRRFVNQNRLFVTRLAAASVILIFLLGSIWFTVNREQQKGVHAQVAAVVNPEILPASNKAILTLANGSRILLDKSGNNTLVAQEGNTKIINREDHLIYHTDQVKGSVNQVAYNTLSTPRGGTYQVTLPDSTKVWLNAASSIKFPAAFIGTERRVEISGEAYFEVAKNRTMPFKVLVNNMEIKVLGTHFDVNAYSDDGTLKTTLCEGSLQVSSKQQTVMIEPGEQSSMDSTGVMIKKRVNVDEAIAWKKGLFQFNHADIRNVMQQVSRWYDVEVTYEGKIPTQLFGGEIERNLVLSQMLNVLGRSQVQFRVEGKKLTVTSD